MIYLFVGLIFIIILFFIDALNTEIEQMKDILKDTIHELNSYSEVKKVKEKKNIKSAVKKPTKKIVKKTK